MNYKLDEVCDFYNGGAWSDKEYVSDGLPVLKVSNCKNKGFQIDNVNYLPVTLKEKYTKNKLRIGDVIIATVGSHPSLIESAAGRSCVVNSLVEGFYLNQNAVCVRTKNLDVLDQRYLGYLCKERNFMHYIQNKGRGAANQMRIAIGAIKEYELDLPDIDIQRRIAHILSAYDDSIENNQKQIKLLEEAAQRLYKEWFIDLRFPGYEDCKIVDGVPVEWKKKKLDEIADVIMGQSPKSEFYNKEHKGLPFHQGVGSYGARFVQDDTYSTSFTKVAEANSILFSVRAPVGRLNITKNKIVIGRGIAAINSKSGFQSYLFYALKERFFKDDILGNGAIFASISKNELLNQVFVIPDEKIMSAYEKIAAALDKKIEVVDMQLQQLVEARDRLLPKLMNGEIEV